MRHAASDSIERARRLRGAASSPTASTPSPRQKSPDQQLFGSDLTKHRGIASSKKNTSLRDLISRVQNRTPTPSVPSSPKTSLVSHILPSSFEDVYAALDFLTNDISLSRPELLSVTNIVKNGLKTRDTDLMALRRLNASLRDQLTDLKEATSSKIALNENLMQQLHSQQEEMTNETRTLRRDLESSKNQLRQKGIN